MPISKHLVERAADIVSEASITHKERGPVIEDTMAAMVVRQHVIVVGRPGSGKSMFFRDLATRITDITSPLLDSEYQPVLDDDGAVRLTQPYFETALDETSDPGQLVGPVDIRAMKTEGKYRRNTQGMLPEAKFGFVDEVMNANGPVRHLLLPIMNERFFHNNGLPTPIPLWSLFSGTNQFDADVSQAAVWDRWHHRHVVSYVRDERALRDLVEAGMARRLSTYAPPKRTTMTEAELAQAHDEALLIPMPDETWAVALAIKAELLHEGIEFSDRRFEDGIVAAKGRAWLNGHEQVSVGDLDIFQHMLWVSHEDMDKARQVILGHTNPGEKAALEGMEEIEKYRAELSRAKDQNLDGTKLQLVGMEIYKGARKILEDAESLKEKAMAAGSSTTRINELIGRAEGLMATVKDDLFEI